MKQQTWHQLTLIQRIRRLRTILPVFLVIVVIFYQLGVATALEQRFGHFVHYSFEIAFYSLAGPIATWLTLQWVERRLLEKESLTQQLAQIREERDQMLAEDRARIARDLHDGVAQTLYFLALKSDMVGQQIPSELDDLRQEVQKMGQNTREIIREIRHTIFALRSLHWAEGEFVPALSQFINDFSQQMDWQTDIQFVTPLSIPPILESAVFRLVQESLNNVAKHGAAKTVQIKIFHSSPDKLDIRIYDDGHGFLVEKVATGGLGLNQMKTRVLKHQGNFSIESAPDSGTTINAQLPTVGGKYGQRITPFTGR
jgi:signal transduction histidine kinase